MSAYTFHADPGHGWLQVTHAEIARLGIDGQISGYSYRDATHAYLEEDCDAPAFTEAKAARGEPMTLEYRHTNNDSPIRRKACYRPRG